MNEDQELRERFAEMYAQDIAPVYTGGKNAAEGNDPHTMRG